MLFIVGSDLGSTLSGMFYGIIGSFWALFLIQKTKLDGSGTNFLVPRGRFLGLIWCCGFLVNNYILGMWLIKSFKQEFGPSCFFPLAWESLRRQAALIFAKPFPKHRCLILDIIVPVPKLRLVNWIFLGFFPGGYTGESLFVNMFRPSPGAGLPSRKLTYPTLGKENHLQTYLGWGYVSSQEGKPFLGFFAWFCPFVHFASQISYFGKNIVMRFRRVGFLHSTVEKQTIQQFVRNTSVYYIGLAVIFIYTFLFIALKVPETMRFWALISFTGGYAMNLVNPADNSENLSSAWHMNEKGYAENVPWWMSWKVGAIDQLAETKWHIFSNLFGLHGIRKMARLFFDSRT